eukprot:230220-Chlamydomonas_euryale.AAC.5
MACVKVQIQAAAFVRWPMLLRAVLARPIACTGVGHLKYAANARPGPGLYWSHCMAAHRLTCGIPPAPARQHFGPLMTEPVTCGSLQLPLQMPLPLHPCCLSLER